MGQPLVGILLFDKQMATDEKNIAIVPCFDSITHDILFEHIAKKLGFGTSCYRDIQKGMFKRRVVYSSIFRAALILIVNIRKIIKQNIREIEYGNVKIGMNINEEVIAFSKTATCRNVPLIVKKTLKAVLIVDFYTPLFSSGKIGLVLCGDEAYVFSGVCAQIACLHNVPCYCIKGGYEVYASKYDCLWRTGFRRDDFDAEKLLGLNEGMLKESESILKRLCSNDKGVLYYMPTSNNNDPSKTMIDYGDLEVIIFAHDFFDAPGIRGGNIYSSHVDWLERTLDFLLHNKTKVGVRFHPNSRPKNRPIIDKLKKKYNSNVAWVDGDLNLKSLKGKIKGIVTVYGTICLEAPYLGIPVVSAGKTQWSLANIVQESVDEEDYRANLLELLSGDGRLDKNEESERKNNAIKVFALGSLERKAGGRVIHYPFDDIDVDLWSSAYNEAYPDNIYQRRDVFLKSELGERLAYDAINKEDIVKIFD